MKENKRIHIKIKGEPQKQDTKEIIADLAFEHGLSQLTNKEQDGIYEIVAEGEKKKLFEFLKTFTSISFTSKVEEIIFYFRDIEDNSKLRLV